MRNVECGMLNVERTNEYKDPAASPIPHSAFTIQHSRGFTLLELVLMMAILAILVTMAVPAMRGFGHGREAGDCAAQMVALTRWARTQAVTRGLTYRLNVNPQDRTFW